MADMDKFLATHYPLDPPRSLKTAGEVRFIKDKSDSTSWAFNDNNQSQREIRNLTGFTFQPKKAKSLAIVLRSALMALGHASSAYTKFTKCKSADISPDGMLGGKGYILKIKDIRQMLMNAVEALSAITDTLHDEINAPHWQEATRYISEEDQAKFKDVIDDVDDIREDPEAFAEEQVH